jgi:glycosyltransferase involved in cell wall biosynthesis
MKILMSAYSCGATKTSEPGVAWRTVNHALNQGHEVWVVVQKSAYEKDMTDHLAQHPMPEFHPVFLELSPWLENLLHRGGMLGSVHYHLWQKKLIGLSRELHKKVGFDLAHHVTFARYWTPSGVRALGIPFIWGPVGAAESSPASFLTELPFKNRVFEFIRDNVRRLSHLEPALRATARAATIALGTTGETCEALRELGAPHVVQFPMSLDDEDLDVFDQFPPPPPGPFRILCIGRLLHWKGFHLAIRAFAKFAQKERDAELWILGTGPFQLELDREAADSGVGSRIRFTGLVPHAQAMTMLAQCHVLLHPALHENFPGVCLEAMAAGRPVICLGIGGPAIQVTVETGFVIPPLNPVDAVEKLAAALTELANDRVLLSEMSAKARIRVRQEFSASRNGAAMNRFYTEAVSARTVSPAAV